MAHLGLTLQALLNIWCGSDKRDQEGIMRQCGRAPLPAVLIRHICPPWQPVGWPKIDRFRTVEPCRRTPYETRFSTPWDVSNVVLHITFVCRDREHFVLIGQLTDRLHAFSRLKAGRYLC